MFIDVVINKLLLHVFTFLFYLYHDYYFIMFSKL